MPAKKRAATRAARPSKPVRPVKLAKPARLPKPTRPEPVRSTISDHDDRDDSAGLNKKDLKRFREILETKRNEILENAKRTLTEDMALDTNDLPDEMDLASSEYLHSFTFRLRGREKTFLKKIDHAIAKLDAGTFGECETCGEMISHKRLEARPETTLCIRCKEDQERMEKAYG